MINDEIFGEIYAYAIREETEESLLDSIIFEIGEKKDEIVGIEKEIKDLEERAELLKSKNRK